MFSKNYFSLIFQTIFLVITSLQLILIPNVFLKTFGFETTTEVWIKVLGIVVLALAVLYYGLNQNGNRETVIWSVRARMTAGLGFVLLVLVGEAKMSLFIFALLDIATAIWTHFELKSKAK